MHSACGQCGCVSTQLLGLPPTTGSSRVVPRAKSLPIPPYTDGFTPLMLASFCGGALDPVPTEEDEAEDTPASIISDLICQGAQLGARTDRTGETALHLAARYARADAAKRLLDAGADTNAQDHSGRTPLHTAVTADAQGVFQVSPRTTCPSGGQAWFPRRAWAQGQEGTLL